MFQNFVKSKSVDFCVDLGMDTLKKLIIEEKEEKNLVLTKILYPQNFSFFLENGRKRPNELVSEKNEKKYRGPSKGPTYCK